MDRYDFICVDKYNEVSTIHGIVGYMILDNIDDNHSFKHHLYIYISQRLLFTTALYVFLSSI